MIGILVTRHSDRSSFDKSPFSSCPTSFLFSFTTMAYLTFWLLSYFLSSLSLCHQHHSHHQPKLKEILLLYFRKYKNYKFIFNSNIEWTVSVIRTKGILMPSSTWNFHRFEKYLAVKQIYVTAVNCHPSYLLITQVSHYLRVAITDPQTVLLGFTWLCLACQ